MLGVTLDRTELRIQSQIASRHSTEAQATKLFGACLSITVFVVAIGIYAASSKLSPHLLSSVALCAMQFFFAAFFASIASFPHYANVPGGLTPEVWQEIVADKTTVDHVLKALIADNNKYINENDRLQRTLDKTVRLAYVVAATTPLTSGLLFFALKLV